MATLNGEIKKVAIEVAKKCPQGAEIEVMPDGRVIVHPYRPSCYPIEDADGQVVAEIQDERDTNDGW